MEALGDLIGLGGFVVLLVVTYVVGSRIEHRHLEDLARREAATRTLATVTLREVPTGWDVTDAALVHGSVVISLDYFKRFLAGLRAIVGGRIAAYEPLLDRARREAMQRMREQAKARGFDAVINVRLETSRLASTGQNGRGTAGVEMLAFGTALKLSRPLA